VSEVYDLWESDCNGVFDARAAQRGLDEFGED